MKPHQLKIDVTKIDKEHIYIGKKGKYLDCAIWPNREGPDEHGMTHYITQSVSKEAREKGIKGAIIGNMKWVDEAPAKPVSKPSAPVRQAAPPDDDSGDIPF